MQQSSPSSSILRSSGLKNDFFTEKCSHGNSKLFNNRMNAFYSDTSYTKHTNQKAFEKSAAKRARQMEKDLSNQSKIKQNIAIKVETVEK
jgi:hypothetical protein